MAKIRVLNAMRSISDRISRGEIVLATGPAKVKRRQHKARTSFTNICSTARLNLVLEQNARMAYVLGEYKQGMNEAARNLFLAWCYIHFTSASPCENHAQYAGEVWFKTALLWRRYSRQATSAANAHSRWSPTTRPATAPRRSSTCSAKVEHLHRKANLPDTAGSGFAFDPTRPSSCN